MSPADGKKKEKEGLITGQMRRSVEAQYSKIYLERQQRGSKLKKRSLILGLCGGAVFLLTWFVLTATIMDKTPGPIETVVTCAPTVVDAWYYKSIYYSLYRVLLGFLVASALAIPLGLMMGWNRIFSDFTMPGFEFLRPVPPVAWVPLSIIIFAQLEYSILFITFTGAFFIVTLNARLGAESIDPSLFRAAWCLGASPRQVFRQVVLPGALPAIFTGLALGMGISWETVVAAEMIAGQYGLGYLTWESYNLIRYPEVILSMVSIGILGYICSALIRAAANKYLAWRKVY
ncbi:MAG: ABC transporter permease [Desulfobacteraceae bacterium]|nr:ABC transporter permease [Desulfobacteraceae bacterium]